VTKALPISELLSFTTGEMLALKRRGWLSSLAETIAEVIMEGVPGPRRSGGPAHQEPLDRIRLLGE